MTDKLLPNRVIVDRTVLVDIMRTAGGNEKADWDDYCKPLIALADEIERGERVELYAADWPTSE